MNVPWCGWGEGWQALQVVDYKAPRTRDSGLKNSSSQKSCPLGPKASTNASYIAQEYCDGPIISRSNTLAKSRSASKGKARMSSGSYQPAPHRPNGRPAPRRGLRTYQLCTIAKSG